jgi:hypothetical protein
MQWVWMVPCFLFNRSDYEANCRMMATFQLLKGSSMLTALIACYYVQLETGGKMNGVPALLTHSCPCCDWHIHAICSVIIENTPNEFHNWRCFDCAPIQWLPYLPLSLSPYAHSPHRSFYVGGIIQSSSIVIMSISKYYCTSVSISLLQFDRYPHMNTYYNHIIGGWFMSWPFLQFPPFGAVVLVLLIDLSSVQLESGVPAPIG